MLSRRATEIPPMSEGFPLGPRRRRRAPWIAAAITIFLLGAGTWILTFDRDGRATQPIHSAEAAALADAAARQAGAERWAPAELAAAEWHLERARRELARQSARWVFLRDYRESRAGFRIADSLAWIAEPLARSRHEEAQSRVRSQLDRAEEVHRQVRTLRYRVRPDPANAKSLRRASSLLAEAEDALGNDELERASALVEQAQTALEGARGSALSLAGRFVDSEQIERWRTWVQGTLDWSRKSGDFAIVVYKEKNLLTLYRGGREVNSFHADMGSNRARDKVKAGDEATPEGRYKITVRKDVGHSRYHRALEIDYPNAEDLARFAALQKSGEVSTDAHPGGLIEIHGDGGRGQDWTRGCVALANSDLDLLFGKVRVGTPVTIVGGDGRDGVFSGLLQSSAPRGTATDAK